MQGATDEECFFQGVRSRLAAQEPHHIGAPAPQAASPQAKLQPPRAAHAHAAAPRVASGEGAQLSQRPDVKTATLVAVTSAQAIILKSAEGLRKEGRGQLLATHRESADGSEAKTPA